MFRRVISGLRIYIGFNCVYGSAIGCGKQGVNRTLGKARRISTASGSERDSS